MTVVYSLDLMGTFAFALSGALVAEQKSFDIFGVVIIAFVTAVGGGMLRDVLIDAHPINWIGDLNYMWIIALAVLVMFLFKSRIAPWAKTFFIFDTIGLGVFTLIGVENALNHGLDPVPAVIMGMITACFGGVIRDVLTNQVPLIFKKEIYASACLLGGVVYLLHHFFHSPENIKAISTVGVVILIRLVSVKYNLQLPRIEKDLFPKKN